METIPAYKEAEVSDWATICLWQRTSYISIRGSLGRIIYVWHGVRILAHVQHVIIKFWKRAAQRTTGLPSTAANLSAFHAGPTR